MMSAAVVVLLLLLWLHLGWCWADILSHFCSKPLRGCRYFMVILLWPASLIITDAGLEEDDEQATEESIREEI